MSKTYESSTLDASGIRQLARETAARYRGNHTGSSMSGWDLGHVVDEGAHDSTLGNWEFGHLFVLRSDGELMYSYYQVYPDRGGIPDDPLLTGEYTLEP